MIEIDLKEFKSYYLLIPASCSKWLISIFHQKIPKCFKIHELESNQIVGLAYVIHQNGRLDHSLIIFPEYQKKGFGTDLIVHLFERYENCIFTVSNLNFRMLKRFEKLCRDFDISRETMESKSFFYRKI